MSGWVVVMRFDVSVAAVDTFRAEASAVARLMSGQQGCRSVTLGRASDDPGMWVLVSHWQTVGDYRRALSSYDVKVHAVPFLSRAIDEPTAFESLLAIDGDGESSASGDLAGDAGTVDRAR